MGLAAALCAARFWSQVDPRGVDPRVLTVLMMVPRVLWRWAGAPPGIATLHRYLLGPMTVVQVAMLAGLYRAFVGATRTLHQTATGQEAAKAAPAESTSETPDPMTTHEPPQ